MDPDQINELSGNPNTPLAFRMMEHLPGFTASFLFAQHRGSNTIMRGGFMDSRKRGPGSLGGFTRGGELLQPTENAFYGTAKRRARLAASAGTSEGKMAIGKGFRANHITARPRALSRYNSLAMFNAAENTAHYSPFQVIAKMGGERLKKNKAFKDAFYGGKEISKEEQVMQRGMVSMITAGRKADIIERKAMAGSGRAVRKLATVQEQVRRLGTMNNPDIGGRVLRGGEFGRVLPKSLGQGIVLPAGQTTRTTSYISSQIGTGSSNIVAANRGLTGNLMASAGSSAGSRGVMGYFRGALGNVNAGGLTDDALKGANLAVSHLSTALGGNKTRVATKALESGVFRTLGVQRTLQAAATKEGAMVLGARTAAMAIPGLNLLATASLVYDLGKMGGELIKSGATLAKDAVKSMKGSIDKPLFGMGYKDNEVSATSRARGVMAIQNSRLNARSMLGSEAGMMAAHFG